MKYAYALAAVAALSLVAPASAATIQVLGAVQDGDSYTNLTPTTYFESGVTAFVGVTGSLAGNYRDVYSGTDLEDVGAYNAVKIGGTMTYALAAAAKSIRLIWGSVDGRNNLLLNLVGGNSELVTGFDILNNPDVQVDAGTTNVIVQVWSLFDIESVTMTSDVNSFEHVFNPPEIPVAPVPVPAAGLLLLAAVGGLGIAARRRKSA